MSGRRVAERAADPLPHACAPAASSPEEPPPFVRRWGVLYALVVAELVLVILVCHWITVRRP